MSASLPGEATLLLRRIAGGDQDARARLAELIYAELRQIAGGQMRTGRENTLSPTAVVHEAWLKLSAGASTDFENRGHFLAVASRAMRSVLVDHVRARRTAKRDGGQALDELALAVASIEADGTDLADLDEALAELEREDAQLAQLVDLRFFGGLSHEEIAAAQTCSLSTVERRWRLARAWLHRRLRGSGEA